jgi:CHAT domain-containing protein
MRLLCLTAIIFLSVTAISAQANEADKIFQEAKELENKSQFKEAHSKFQQALELYEKQKNKKGIADTLYQLGNINNLLTQYKDAISVLERAKKLHAELKDRKAMATDITDLAEIHMLIGNLEESLKLTTEAMKIHEAIGNQEGIASTLLVIASCYLDQAKIELGIETTKRAFDVSVQIGDETLKAKSLGLLGTFYKYKGDHDLSLDYYQQSNSINERLGKRSMIADTLINIGAVYAELGDLPKSLEYYSQSAEMFEEFGDQYGISVVNNNMGVSYYRLGEYEKAREAFQRSYDISVATGAKQGQAMGLSNVAYVSMELGNYDDALNRFQKALKISEEADDKWAIVSTLSGTANCYENQGKYSTAFEYYKKAYQLAVESEFKMPQANNLMMMGVMNWKSGKTDSVLENLQKSAALLESTGTQHGLAENLYWTGAVQLSMNHLADAEAALLKSIHIANEIGYVYSLSPALHKLAIVYRDSGRSEEAIQKLVEAVNVIESSRKELKLAEQRTGFFQSKVDVYDDLVSLLVSSNHIDQAFEYVQRSKARGFVDMLAEAKIDPEKYLSDDLRKKKKSLLSDLMMVHNRIEQETDQETTDKTKIRELLRKRSDLQSSLTNLVLEIRQQNPEYAELQYQKPLTLSEAQALLQEQDVVFEYYVRKSASLLFAVSKSEAHVFKLPKSEKLRDEISQLREALLNPDEAYNTIHHSYTKYGQLSQRLYNELLTPAQKMIKGKRIILAPDGPLNYLPFESLLTKKTNLSQINFANLPYLARDHEISYVSSMSVLFSVLQRKKEPIENTQKQLLAFADPQLNNLSTQGPSTRANTLIPLEYARAEVAEIARLYRAKDVTVLIGPEASERRLKQMDLKSYRALHFASHALIDEQHPEFSSLMLTPDEKGGEDGYLTMREIFDLKFNADLIVLSACKTGLGKEFSGEGLTGISRAFLLSGTPSVVVSLWDVYDRSTAQLMAAFYKNLKNKNKAAAIKQARIELIQSGKFSHPYYWAPFILIGSN